MESLIGDFMEKDEFQDCLNFFDEKYIDFFN